MTSDALSSWDRERLATALAAFRNTIEPVRSGTRPEQDGDVPDAILAAIRAADTVKPPPEAAKPLPDPSRFFRRLEAALRTLADPGTDVDTSNGHNQEQRWQDYWLTVDGTVWFIMCRPNKRYTTMPLAPGPERYDSLGRPVSEPTGTTD